MHFWKPSPSCVHFLILLVKIKHPSLSRRKRWRLISLLQRAICRLLCISLWPPYTYHCTFWALARCTSPCKDDCSEYMFPHTPKMFKKNQFYFVPFCDRVAKKTFLRKMLKNRKRNGEQRRRWAIKKKHYWQGYAHILVFIKSGANFEASILFYSILPKHYLEWVGDKRTFFQI